MRYLCAALMMLMTFVSTASAQDPFRLLTAKAPILVVEDVVAHLMLFDRNGDGFVATSELSERMQPLVARGDRGGDGALDAAEIRSLAGSTQQARNVQFGGGYGFGDSLGQTSRMHIDSTIDDLRLASSANEEAKRIATAFADELEENAFAEFRKAVAPLVSEEQLAQFDADLKRGAGIRMIQLSQNSQASQTFVIRAAVSGVVFRHHLTIDQMKVVAPAVAKFNAGQQLDDVSRAALVDRLSGILTEQERDDFRAALARRPLVKQSAAAFAGQIQVMAEELKMRAVVNGALRGN